MNPNYANKNQPNPALLEMADLDAGKHLFAVGVNWTFGDWYFYSTGSGFTDL